MYIYQNVSTYIFMTLPRGNTPEIPTFTQAVPSTQIIRIALIPKHIQELTSSARHILLDRSIPYFSSLVPQFSNILKNVMAFHNNVCPDLQLPYIFRGWSLHSHGNQVLPTQQHQTQNPLFFTLRLLRILWPINQK